MSLPSPIISSLFSDHACAMLRFHEALKLTKISFPFAYVCLVEVLLLLHAVITPIMVSEWTSASLVCGGLTFITIATMWSLNAIALEMDNPFSIGENLDGQMMQDDLNKRLIALFHLP